MADREKLLRLDGNRGDGPTARQVAGGSRYEVSGARVRGGGMQPPTTLNNTGIRHSFKVGDMAVHPAHGVGEVERLEDRDFGGRMTTVYVIKIRDSGLKVMVPTETTERVGLRPVMKKKEAQKILDILKAPEVAVDVQPWNRRFRAYTEMLKSGLPSEIAKVLRDMYRLRFDKDLSFGERRLLDQARSLLVQELALAKKVPPSTMEGEIQQIFQA
ncbi:MAG TPA: CarD family transcriptional regulator [Polyangiaceae bacterium]